MCRASQQHLKLCEAKTNRVARESDEFISQLEISSLYQKWTDFIDKKSVWTQLAQQISNSKIKQPNFKKG